MRQFTEVEKYQGDSTLEITLLHFRKKSINLTASNLQKELLLFLNYIMTSKDISYFGKRDFYYYIRQLMGQEQSKLEINNKAQTTVLNSTITSSRKSISIDPKKIERVQCEGLLKLRPIPFKNSIEIQTQTEVMFLENVQTTLKQLLETRLNTNKLFLIQDIERLIEEITYTLAFLLQKNILYKDVNAQYIYYDNGNFKMLPNQLIQTTTYQKLKLDQEVYPSPELIIGLRCGQDQILDEDIVQKSNVFTLGMLLMEVATLLPSSQCYDSENYDILDEIINERLIMVEEYYSNKISRIIANMLDYDYTERMGFKELSIWINRQLQQSRNTQSTSQPNIVPSIIASKVQKNIQPKVIQNAFPSQSHSKLSQEKPRAKLAKNNSVYMGYNRQAQPQKQDKHKIYINQNSRFQEMQARSYPSEISQNYRKKRNQVILEHHPKELREPQKSLQVNDLSFNESQSFKINEYVKQELRNPNPYCEDFKFQQRRDEGGMKNQIERETTKRATKQGVNPYRFQQPNRFQSKDKQPSGVEFRKEKTALREISNQFYPNIEDILKNKPSQNSMQIKSPIGENGALNRIKEQILKSRKLIEQFKKSEGFKN